MRPVETSGLTRYAPVVWRSGNEDAAFVFDVATATEPFICFFLMGDPERLAPKLSVDRGDGFDEPSAMVFRRFPFAFYHASLAKLDGARRLRFRPCEEAATFRFVAFGTNNAVFVAILHFLFNLRYQRIALVEGAARGRRGLWPTITSNAARIRKFFADVSVGGGVRVQQTEDDVLARLLLAQSLQAAPLQEAMRRTLAERGECPLITFVVPTFNTHPDFLDDLLASYTSEDAAYSELVLSDDGSTSATTKAALARAAAASNVSVLTSPANRGIAAATNAGIEAAKGDWIAFIDHDDAFIAGAVAMIAKAIVDHPDADFFYTDEVIANGALVPVGSFCKPGYDSVLLSGLNYINHFSVFRREKLRALGGLRPDCEGSQDYDLLLRYLKDSRPGAIVHVPFFAYIWRRGEESYSAIHRARTVGNARTVLVSAYAAAGRAIAVEPATDPDLHRVRFLKAARPTITAVIANKDSPTLIRRVVADLRERTRYPELEIVIVDNGTTDTETLSFYDTMRSDWFRVDLVDEPFSFARMCNRGARAAKGDAILFLNNDIEVIDPVWLAEMAECLHFEDAGIVGARLLYPNGKIQHAGVIVGLGSAAGHWYVEESADEPGPQGRLTVRQTLTAVTGACMLVTRACFETVGGFDEVLFPIAYNDIDFCVRARQAGFRTVWTPFATLVHHESLSRGSDETGENNIRFRTEFANLQERHGTATYLDEAFSPFYDRRYSRPHLALPGALPAPRRNSLT